MPLENSLQRFVMRKLNNIVNCEAEKATTTNKNGSQDIKGHISGYYYALELKRDEKTKPDPLQLYRIYTTNKKGGFSVWIGSKDEFYKFLRDFSKAKGIKIEWKK